MDVCLTRPARPEMPGRKSTWTRRLTGGAVALAAMVILGAGPSMRAQQPPSPPSSQPPPASGAPAAQDAPAGQPVFRTGINFVRVDVIVSDRQGRPVADLSKGDFEILEDNKPQVVQTFKLVTLDGNPRPGEDAPRAIRSDFDEETEAQREDVRIFVFVLDDYHVRRSTSMAVRQPLINFIRTQVGPMDLLGVMYPLTPVTDMRLTRNHEGIIRVIEKFEGRKFDYRPRNEFEEQYSQYPVEIVERVRNQVSLSAVEGLAVRLGGLREGRKSIVLVSEGYSNYVPPQLRDSNAEIGGGIGNPNRRNPFAGENSQAEDRARFFSDIDLQSEMRDVYAACNRANASIYTLDPRGLAVFEFDIDQGIGFKQDSQSLNATQDSLRVLADETDGRAIVNRNDLDGGLKQVVRDASAYYLVGYDSSQAPSDGKFHEIKVRVKRPGVQVRARKGYWALTAEEATRAVAPPAPGPERGITEALAAVSSANRARAIRTWVGMEPASSGRTRVTFVWEPAATVPGDRREVPARVSLIAAGGDGQPYFRGKVPGEAGEAPVSRAAFDAVPGKLQLRLSIEGTSGQMIDSDVLDLVVPDFTTPQIALTSLAVHRARTAREFQQIVADPAAVPFAGREFRRTDRLLIRFGARAPGEAPVSPVATLLNRAGQKMVDLPVKAPADAGAPFQVDLPLSSLPSGEYVIEVKAGDAGSEVKQFLGVKVIS